MDLLHDTVVSIFAANKYVGGGVTAGTILLNQTWEPDDKGTAAWWIRGSAWERMAEMYNYRQMGIFISLHTITNNFTDVIKDICMIQETVKHLPAKKTKKQKSKQWFTYFLASPKSMILIWLLVLLTHRIFSGCVEKMIKINNKNYLIRASHVIIRVQIYALL